MSGVHLYTVCWNEADMLGFFFRHYDRWVDRYVVYDDGSDDGTLEMLHAHPRVEVRPFPREADSFVHAHTAINNTAWHESRGHADWVVLADIDELYDHPHRPMTDYLAQARATGVTVIPGLGFGMVAESLPPDSGQLCDLVRTGRPRAAFNKLGIFSPDAVSETRIQHGRHLAAPVGDVRLPARDEVMLKHFKHLGFERWCARDDALGARRGSRDLAERLGRHYAQTREERAAFWAELIAEADDLGSPDLVPAARAVGPLWWQDLPRADPAADTDNSRRAPVSRPREGVHLYTQCWNEAPMLGFLFRHYDRWVDRYFVADDGSDDESRAILEAHPKVEIVPFSHDATGSFIPAQTEFNNHAWKQSRGWADWVVLADVDEHFAHAHVPMRRYLADQRASGVTLIPGLGFDMISEEFPDDEGLLVKRVQYGVARRAFNKLGIFDPEAIDEVDTQHGRHLASPSGRVLLPARDEVTLRHFKYLGKEYWTRREEVLDARRSRFEVESRLSHHYTKTAAEREEIWAMVTRGARRLAGPGFHADQRAEGPPWWVGLPRVR